MSQDCAAPLLKRPLVSRLHHPWDLTGACACTCTECAVLWICPLTTRGCDADAAGDRPALYWYNSSCNRSMMQVTVNTASAVVYILLCSACLLFDSKHSANQHLCLHTFLARQWQEDRSPVHYFLMLHARMEHTCQSYCNILSRDVAVWIRLGSVRCDLALSEPVEWESRHLKKVLCQALPLMKAFPCTDLKIDKITSP